VIPAGIAAPVTAPPHLVQVCALADGGELERAELLQVDLGHRRCSCVVASGGDVARVVVGLELGPVTVVHCSCSRLRLLEVAAVSVG
jgi:hypothetical protein